MSTLPMPTECPVTGEPLEVTRLECPTSGVVIEGRFQPNEFALLPEEQLEFMRIFIKVRGNLKEVERVLGLSYPTVRQRFEGLPFAAGSFDLVIQAVVFSSILDESARRGLAAEMARVLRPGGHLLWVDHKASFPPRLAGFSQAQVREYFPSGEIVHAESVHPRYFRRLHRHAWLARLLYRASRARCDSWLLVLRLG